MPMPYRPDPSLRHTYNAVKYMTYKLVFSSNKHPIIYKGGR